MAEARANPVVPRGSTADRPYDVVVSPENAGWAHSGLRVVQLPVGGRVTFVTGSDEMLVLPLSGGCDVACDDERLTLTGRRSVFSRVTDFAYLPRDAAVTLRAPNGGRFALPAARARRQLPFRYGAAEDVPVELRGAGSASRQVNNFCTPESFEADALIAVEVLTPGGNWSSYPPHRHDTLEEIYYYEVATSPSGRPGCGYQRVYGDQDRPIDVCAEVRTGDVVLIPYGWHGPSMAAPGYDLYYLNVMAGPGERRWLITDDPAHGWVREAWAVQAVDPRLPLTTDRELLTRRRT
ncbi:5-deoxyglucuronate isomerase [Actinoplanes sp. SE50]|uniref:5-deoxy-glucuronate isomerase n=1 Tax=unclassified Actinoplanes TaxID=2626549 RepID=UPI00023ECE6B|nr:MULTISPECIES: 5-deoxy-glucuronate isomerase [unclassified Actinoplanes]AEV83815.1 5-deoxy-glucuronate isomerase [Actinoplanes sp. SE50/110]ATO82041.1 5-deoxyglucuronate isomerase [Actinoplanes sp. SE50]SLL99449.1 5-deoxy-glucuronate isomerase [Actinoplanes sp. SE50/110]